MLSRLSTQYVSGISDSPIWKRGKRSRSNSCTLTPCCASREDTVEPAGPPPMTTTSEFVFMSPRPPTTNQPSAFHYKAAGLHLKPWKRTTGYDVHGHRQAKGLAKLIRHARGNCCTVACLRTKLDLEP